MNVPVGTESFPDALAASQLALREREARDSVARAGYPVSQELPGDDRSEDATALYNAAFNWAGIDQESR
jgi:hypothetical protein